jgi:hypothetical protein
LVYEGTVRAFGAPNAAVAERAAAQPPTGDTSAVRSSSKNFQ